MCVQPSRDIIISLSNVVIVVSSQLYAQLILKTTRIIYLKISDVSATAVAFF